MRFERRHPGRALWPLLLLFVAIGGGRWVLMPGPRGSAPIEARPEAKEKAAKLPLAAADESEGGAI